MPPEANRMLHEYVSEHADRLEDHCHEHPNKVMIETRHKLLAPFQASASNLVPVICFRTFRIIAFSLFILQFLISESKQMPKEPWIVVAQRNVSKGRPRRVHFPALGIPGKHPSTTDVITLIMRLAQPPCLRQQFKEL
jgi:hypothetical protein